MANSRLENEAKDLYQSGYTPDDSLVGIMTGVNANQETKNLVNDKYYNDYDKVNTEEAREINRIIRDNQETWSSGSEDNGFGEILWFLIQAVMAIKYVLFDLAENRVLQEACVHAGILRLTKSKNGQTMQERVEKEYQRAYLGRFWMIMGLLLIFGVYMGSCIYAYFDDCKLLPALQVLLVLDAIVTLDYIRVIFGAGLHPILCIHKGLDKVYEKVKRYNGVRRYSILLFLKGITFGLYLGGGWMVGETEWVVCGIITMLAFVVAIVGFIASNYFVRRQYSLKQMPALSVPRAREIFEGKILPELNSNVDFYSAKGKAWKKIGVHSLALLSVLVLCSLMVYTAPTVTEKWNSVKVNVEEKKAEEKKVDEKDFFQIKINNKKVVLPCSYEEFLKKTKLTVNEEDIINGYESGNNTACCPIYDGEKCVALFDLYWSMDAIDYSDAMVVGIRMCEAETDIYSKLNWSFEGLDAKSSIDDVIDVFGEPIYESEIMDGEYYEFEIYKGDALENRYLYYVVFENDKILESQVCYDIYRIQADE